MHIIIDYEKSENTLRSPKTEFVQLPSPVEVSAPTDSGSIIIHVGEITVYVKGSVSRTSLKNLLKVLQEM